MSSKSLGEALCFRLGQEDETNGTDRSSMVLFFEAIDRKDGDDPEKVDRLKHYTMGRLAARNNDGK